MDSEQFDVFIKCLSNLKEVCNDVDIKGGFIRQRTNCRTTIFEMDLTPIIDDINISLIELKNKIDILKVFSNQDVSIEINESDENPDEGEYIISDNYSSIRITKPSPSFIDNSFITEEEINNIYTFQENELLMETDITKMISDRIKNITTAFGSPSIQIFFNGGTCDMSASNQSRQQVATFLKDIIINEDMNESFANLTLITFRIDHDENINFKMFYDDDRKITTNMFKTGLGEIQINMYSNSSVIEDD
jgi:hypothetical protein